MPKATPLILATASTDRDAYFSDRSLFNDPITGSDVATLLAEAERRFPYDPVVVVDQNAARETLKGAAESLIKSMGAVVRGMVVASGVESGKREIRMTIGNVVFFEDKPKRADLIYALPATLRELSSSRQLDEGTESILRVCRDGIGVL